MNPILSIPFFKDSWPQTAKVTEKNIRRKFFITFISSIKSYSSLCKESNLYTFTVSISWESNYYLPIQGAVDPILLLHHVPSQHQHIDPTFGKRVPGVCWTTYNRFAPQVETGVRWGDVHKIIRFFCLAFSSFQSVSSVWFVLIFILRMEWSR